MFSHRRLIVWQKSHEAAKRAYRLAELFPREERFGLAAQLRRAATSVPINIAEGSRRCSEREYAHFLNIAEGSAVESEYIVEFSSEMSLVPSDPASDVAIRFREITLMLYRLRKRLK